jgi:hypothetical protein
MHRLLAPFIRVAAFTSLLRYTALVLAAPGEYLWAETNWAPHRAIVCYLFINRVEACSFAITHP